MKRAVSLVLSLILILSLFTGLNINAYAATYNKIANLKVPRFYQNYSKSSGGDGSCWIASFVSIDCYRRGNKYNGKTYSFGKDYSHKDQLYIDDIALNNNSKGWPGDGAKIYKTLKISKHNYSLSGVYNALKAGKPVVIYSYGTPHASVVIGYNANTSSLKKENFVVMEISQGYSQENCYKKLSTWINSHGTPSYMWYQNEKPDNTKVTNLSVSSSSVKLNLKTTIS